MRNQHARHTSSSRAAPPSTEAPTVRIYPLGIVTAPRLQAMQQVVAELIHAVRLAADLSQDEVAVRLGWGRTRYVKKEIGTVCITVPEFFVIAPALNLSAVQLLREVLALDLHEPSLK